MSDLQRYLLTSLVLLFVVGSLPQLVRAQDSATVLSGSELAQVVPTGFYFLARSAPTQMRNSAAVRFGSKRFVIAGMVDTSGYASEVAEKYEGFLITDSPVSIGGSELATGAYGFGFTKDGRLLIQDLGGKELLSVSTTKDNELKRPRPLMMMKSADGVRLYRGRNYVIIASR